MTLIIETGAGLRNSNAYATEAFVDTYLTDRDRFTENDWSGASNKEAAIIAATSYIDTRWGPSFIGIRVTTFKGVGAEALIDFTGNPAADDQVVIGDQTYVFQTVLTPLAANEVLIGADAEESASNFKVAVASGENTPQIYSEALEFNISATVDFEDSSTTLLRASARSTGDSGNDILLSATSAGITVVSPFVNGKDSASQALEFPRASLFEKNGKQVVGIPTSLKWAMSEYAVRAIALPLYTDPTVDPTGRVVTGNREKIGPIETAVSYKSTGGLSQLLTPYPGADRMLQDYVRAGGKVIRA